MIFIAGDVVAADFQGVTGIKRRPAVVLSSYIYHTQRPDVLLGLITTRFSNLGTTDYILQDWAAAGLRSASVFRSFIITAFPSANLILIGRLSDRDWNGVRACVKLALADLNP